MCSCLLHCLPEITAQFQSFFPLPFSYESASDSTKFPHPARGGRKTVFIRTLCHHERLFLRPECQKPPQKCPKTQEEGLCSLVWVLTDRTLYRGWLLLVAFDSQGRENGRELSFCFLDLASRAGLGFGQGEVHIWKDGSSWKAVLVCSIRVCIERLNEAITDQPFLTSGSLGRNSQTLTQMEINQCIC